MFSFGHVEQSFSLLSFIIFLTQFSIFFSFRKSPRHTILPSSSPQMKKPLALNCGALFGHQHISNWMSLAGGGRGCSALWRLAHTWSYEGTHTRTEESWLDFEHESLISCVGACIVLEFLKSRQSLCTWWGQGNRQQKRMVVPVSFVFTVSNLKGL